MQQFKSQLAPKDITSIRLGSFWRVKPGFVSDHTALLPKQTNRKGVVGIAEEKKPCSSFYIFLQMNHFGRGFYFFYSHG